MKMVWDDARGPQTRRWCFLGWDWLVRRFLGLLADRPVAQVALFSRFASLRIDTGVLVKTHTNTDIRGRPHHEHEHGGERSMVSRLKMDFGAHAAHEAAWRCQSTLSMDSGIRVCFGRLTATMFPNRSKGRPKHAGGL